MASLIPATAQTTSNDAAATSALALVNRWRIENGFPPLMLNPILQRMAEAQALYIAPNIDSIEDETAYHKDIQGRTAIQRAIQVYGWPNYGLKEQVEVGENAAHYPPNRAVDFWKSSAPHRKAALSATYREVGVVAIPQKPKGSFVFYMTFGARPLELTALLDPATNQIFLTKEQSRYYKGDETKLTVRFYTYDRQSRTEEMPWKDHMTLPVGLGDPFYVVYGGYKNKEPIWVEVSSKRNVAILPENKMTVTEQLTAITEANNPTPAGTVVVGQPSPTNSELVSVSTANATAVAPTRTRVGALATNTPRGTVKAASPTPAATAVPSTPTAVAVLPSPTATTGAAAQADITITYSARAMFITNTSGKPVNITNLKVGRLSVQSWLKVFQFNTERFPNGYCLQASVSGASSENPPNTCRNVQSEINVLNNPVFWLQSDFEVKVNDEVIKQCVAGAEQCEVDLP